MRNFKVRDWVRTHKDAYHGGMIGVVKGVALLPDYWLVSVSTPAGWDNCVYRGWQLTNITQELYMEL